MISMFLVTVDAHSRWPEPYIMSSTTSSNTIEVLRTMFATRGLPTQIVSDNGSQLISEECETFLFYSILFKWKNDEGNIEK